MLNNDGSTRQSQSRQWNANHPSFRTVDFFLNGLGSLGLLAMTVPSIAFFISLFVNLYPSAPRLDQLQQINALVVDQGMFRYPTYGSSSPPPATKLELTYANGGVSGILGDHPLFIEGDTRSELGRLNAGDNVSIWVKASEYGRRQGITMWQLSRDGQMIVSLTRSSTDADRKYRNIKLSLLALFIFGAAFSTITWIRFSRIPPPPPPLSDNPIWKDF